MRRFPSFLTAALILSCGVAASAEAVTFTDTLSLGASGPQVTALQKILNQDPATQIASTGVGSPGNESAYFGQRTKAAVARFQEKYASDILTPIGLTRGNGAVRMLTRAKLNTLSTTTSSNPTGTISSTTSIIATSSPAAAYLVKESEKVDIYVGDKVIAATQDKITAAVNVSIASRGATPISIPKPLFSNTPLVAIGAPSPRSAIPGTHISIVGKGISTDSVLYFGDTYITHTIIKGIGNNFIFVVPPIPPGRYDIAVRTGGIVSNTVTFVVTNLKNPRVHIDTVSPTAVHYGDSITITGSGLVTFNNPFTNSGIIYQVPVDAPP